MKKIGALLPCLDAPLFPIHPRATSNSLCVTNRLHNNFVSNKTIQVGNKLLAIPCFILPYTDEFAKLIPQVGYFDAIKLLAVKYNVNIDPERQNVKRYIYPNVNFGTMPPVIQFNSSFRFDELANVSILPLVGKDWSIMSKDARYVSVCNDDTKTFSSSYTEMQSLAKYWTAKLPTFEEQYYYVLVQSSKDTYNTQSGCLLLDNDRIIFVPIIYNELFLFYKSYLENTPINLLYIGSLSMIKTKLDDAYETVQSVCELKKKYPRWV
jgi:hypothetical protein